MRTRLLCVVATLAMICFGKSSASDEISKRVQGYWLVTSSSDLASAVLNVKEHKENKPGRYEYNGYFGTNDAQFPMLLEVIVTSTNSGLVLSASNEAVKIEAKQEGSSLFVGSIATNRGTFQARLDKMTEGGVKDYLLNIPAVSKNARLEMIYLSSADCTWCARWESTSKRELLASSEGKTLRFVEVKNATLSMPIVERDYPANYKWVYEQVGSTRGVPRFILAIDGKVVLSTFGNGYDSVFLPALKRVVEKRESSK